jgi:hypothetical protein
MFRQVGLLASSKVRHVGVGPRIEGIDEHLALGRPGQLYPTALEVGSRDWSDLPVTVTDPLGAPQPTRSLARVEPLLTLVAGIEQQVARLAERALQTPDKGERGRREHLLGSVDPRPADLDAFGGG